MQDIYVCRKQAVRGYNNRRCCIQKKKSTKRKHNRKYGEGRENNNNQCKAPERNLSVVEKKEGISKK